MGRGDRRIASAVNRATVVVGVASLQRQRRRATIERPDQLISQRLVNETAQALAEIEQRFLAAATPNCASATGSHTFLYVKRLLVVALWLGACGGGDGDSIPIDQLAGRAMDVVCALEIRCGAVPDRAACDEIVNQRLQLEADVKAGKVIYDGRAAATCLNAYSTFGCSASDVALFSASRLQSCEDAVKGTVATGGSCLSDDECLSQACDRSACNGTVECCAGTCAAKIPAGGDCSVAEARCADELFCRRSTTDQTAICTARIGDGQPCISTDVCVAGRRCNIVTGTGAGTCGAFPAHGQACPGNACDSSTDVCDPASKTCVSRIALGGDCSAFGTGCVAYANCDPTTKTCVARKRAGEACAATTDCLGGVVACMDGVCVARADEPACP